MSRTFNGELEILDDGRVYFHDAATGATLLRIQYLPAPVPTPEPGAALDISLRPLVLGGDPWREQVDAGGNGHIGFSWRWKQWGPK